MKDPTMREMRLAIERDHWNNEELALLFGKLVGKRYLSDIIMRCRKANILGALDELGWKNR